MQSSGNVSSLHILFGVFKKGFYPQGLTRHIENERGVSMLEFALSLPLFLILFGLVLFAGHAYSSSVSVATAVKSVRLAHTRSIYQYVSEIDDAIDGSPPAGWPAPYIASTDLAATAPSYYAAKFNFIYKPATTNFDASNYMQRVPNHVFYAMTYAYAQLRASISENLRYPCEEPGCASCYPHQPLPVAPNWPPPLGSFPQPTPTPHPIDYRPDLYSGPLIFPPANIDDPTPLTPNLFFDANFTGIVCDYYLDSVILTPVLVGLDAMFGLPQSLMFVRHVSYFKSNR